MSTSLFQPRSGLKHRTSATLAAFLCVTLACIGLFQYRVYIDGGDWGFSVCPTPSETARTLSDCGTSVPQPDPTAQIANFLERVWPSYCNSSYPPYVHLRTETPTLDFQWLALHSSATQITLRGPKGNTIPLQELGTLPLVDQKIYVLPPTRDVGEHQLFIGDGDSPISTFQLYPHQCSCPESLPQFSERYKCSERAIQVVKKSIARCPKKSITRELFQQVPFYGNNITIHFAIVANKLYCKKVHFQKCPPPRDDGRASDIVLHIQRVLRRVKVPDMWFTWNLDDGPLLPPYAVHPLFSPAGTAFNRDFLLPDPYMSAWKSSGEDLKSAIAGAAWEERKAKAYFIGRPTGGPYHYLLHATGAHRLHPRLHAVELSRERPDLLDAMVTADKDSGTDVSSFPVLEKLVKSGLLETRFQESRQNEFKYNLDLPGNSAAWRLSFNLGFGAVTIKSRTPYYTYWQYLLEDGRNVRMTEDMLADLFDVVEDAKRRDADMKCIAREAQLTAMLDLKQEDLLCWTAHSLIEASSIMAFTPTMEDDLTLVEDLGLQDPSTCQCI
ncbi:hypothetical protein KFL_003540130 [Klebsormidium nitens]|uniref:Glycosyl transferase CAP10 domain-containing protein n=1 Tax=Klebsormidium nitens TaxID=105231 RepID=A0A1Y1I950_KLENI|nr:hypothetical protein KFL_003540130 [Klebsormidium nitens]|eukprot:GAQ87460.1 hypothetical protein KFL_003540130 [Klebsormidium nitens]